MKFRFLKGAVVFYIALLVVLVIQIAGFSAAEEDSETDDSEQLLPSEKYPGLFVDSSGEIVDEFGLIVRLSENKDNCVKCHYNKEKYEKLVLDWDKSKHSENKVTCIKCHGGDPSGASAGDGKDSKKTNFRHIKEPLRELALFWSGGASMSRPNNKVIAFAFDYCGQCHGTIYRDWKVGIHGKRTGYWNGDKEYRICLKCHDPHNPKFKQLKPDPPPLRPRQIKYHPTIESKKPPGLEISE